MRLFYKWQFEMIMCNSRHMYKRQWGWNLYTRWKKGNLQIIETATGITDLFSLFIGHLRLTSYRLSMKQVMQKKTGSRLLHEDEDQQKSCKPQYAGLNFHQTRKLGKNATVVQILFEWSVAGDQG